jgi:chorismate mutase
MARRKPAAGNGARPGRAAADPMEDLRRRIDAIDRSLVRLLNERAGHAIALGRIKQARGLPIYQPAREEEVLANVQSDNGGPLQDSALRRLFERIIDESRRIERLSTASSADEGGVPGAPGAREDSSG